MIGKQIGLVCVLLLLFLGITTVFVEIHSLSVFTPEILEARDKMPNEYRIAYESPIQSVKVVEPVYSKMSEIPAKTEKPVVKKETKSPVVISCLETFQAKVDKIKESLEKSSKPIAKCLLENPHSGFKCMNDFATKRFLKKQTVEDQQMKFPVFPPYSTLLQPTHPACSNDTYAVIGIPTSPNQLEQRVAIRQTFCSVKRVNEQNLRCLFFMGSDSSSSSSSTHSSTHSSSSFSTSPSELQYEQSLYNDIIQFDFTNHFMNLTLLSILTFNWTSTLCPSISYFVRVDSDMFYNPFNHFSNTLSLTHSNSIFGISIPNGKPNRNPSSRYFLSKDIYPKNSFPPYVSGCFVTVSGDLLGRIVTTSQMIGPIVYLDDVFLGLVAQKAKMKLQYYNEREAYFVNAPYTQSLYHSLIASHRFSPSDLVATWGLLMNEFVYLEGSKSMTLKNHVVGDVIVV